MIGVGGLWRMLLYDADLDGYPLSQCFARSRPQLRHHLKRAALISKVFAQALVWSAVEILRPYRLGDDSGATHGSVLAQELVCCGLCCYGERTGKADDGGIGTANEPFC